MITANSWSVKGFNIERGSNNSIQNGKVIHFSEDGSCEVFHSMENAWHINNGRIETYYRQTNEPMFVYTLLSKNDDEITVQMNGTLDDNLQATLTLTKEVINESVTETYWSNKESVYSLRNTCYAYCADFEKAQLSLEKTRSNPNTVHTITPTSNEISKAWNSAYLTINAANIILDNASQFNNLFDTEELNKLLAEIRFIRAFVYYNIAMLWGNVPLVTTASIDIGTTFPQSLQFDIYSFAYKEVNEVMGYLNQTNDKLFVSLDAAQLLKAELEMARGNSANAQSALNQVNKQKYEGVITSISGEAERPVIWALNQTGISSHYPIYTYSHLLLYEKELLGNKDGLEIEWQNASFVEYGYWATLKRTGKAQAVTGCFEHELLMPFPYSDIEANPNMIQNSGY